MNSSIRGFCFLVTLSLSGLLWNAQEVNPSSSRVLGWSSRYYIEPRYMTNVAELLTNIVAIATRNRHALGLMTDGTVVDWGEYTTDGGVFTTYQNIGAENCGRLPGLNGRGLPVHSAQANSSRTATPFPSSVA